MAGKTVIEWTDATWNPIRGCTRVSEGCRNCYAERIASRFTKPGQAYFGVADPTQPVSKWTGILTIGHNMDAPLAWKKPRRIFVNSMSDLFHESLPIDDIATIFAICVAAHHLHGHTLQILTKRAEHMQFVLTDRPDFWDQVNAEAGLHVMHLTDPLNRTRDDARATLQEYGPTNPPPGIWLGVSVENQDTADQRIPLLLETPAAKRFLSCEPLLGPVDLTAIQAPRFVPEDHVIDWKFSCLETGSYYFFDTGELSSSGDGPQRDTKIDWVIAGGESGPNARPMHPAWPRLLRDQCAAAGVPFFFKQWGNHLHALQKDANGRLCDNAWRGGGPDGEWGLKDWEDGTYSIKIGKKAAGALLDGIEYKAFPNA